MIKPLAGHPRASASNRDCPILKCSAPEFGKGSGREDLWQITIGHRIVFFDAMTLRAFPYSPGGFVIAHWRRGKSNSQWARLRML